MNAPRSKLLMLLAPRAGLPAVARVNRGERRLDSVPLAASEASRGATGGQAESHE
jgi:hypothetical protein